MNAKEWELFFEIHRDLPREGPGSDQSTIMAYSLVPDLPDRPEILDIGCGPGAQTLCLARAGMGKITAVDNHEPFLEQLRRRAAEKGVADRIVPLRADMCALSLPPGSFDLLWAEGSIFIIGVEKGLAQWRPLLKPRGCIAFTEASWLRPDPPAELAEFWKNEYPDIVDIEMTQERIEKAGYTLIADFELSADEWRREYYDPIAARLPAMKEKHASDPLAMKVIEAHEQEMAMLEKYSAWYGYVFYIAQRAD